MKKNFSKTYEVNGEEIKFRISEDYGSVIPFDELLEKMDYCFQKKYKEGVLNNPWICLKEPIKGYSKFFEISYNNSGICLGAEMEIGEINELEDVSKDAPTMIYEFLKQEGCAVDFVYDKDRYRNYAFPPRHEFA